MTELPDDKSRKIVPQGKETPQELSRIQEELKLAGAPEEVTNHIERYEDKDVPIVYTGESHEAIWGSGDKNYGKKVRTSLAVGMKAPIYERGSKYSDQNASVVVQWRGREFIDGDRGSNGIEREEAEQIGEDIYIKREYRNVSALGSFDGELWKIAIEAKSGEFHPESNYPGRNEYHGVEFVKKKDGTWSAPFKYSTAVILNGAQELLAFHLGEIVTIKDELPLERKQLPTSQDIVEGSEKTEKRLLQLLEQNQKIIGEMKRWMEEIYGASISQLEDGRVLGNAIEMLQNGILSYPERVFVAGRVLSIFSESGRFKLAQALAREGKERFTKWYAEKRLKDLFTGSSLRNRIVDKNLYHFIQFWDIHTEGKFGEPDWEAMDKAHQSLTGGKNRKLYPLYVKVFDGLQTSALECFLEDEIIEQAMASEAKMPKVLPRITE